MDYLATICTALLLCATFLSGTAKEVIMGRTKKPGTSVHRRPVGPVSTPLPFRFSNVSTSFVVKALRTNYDRSQPPQKDRPTEVQLGIYIISFFSISEQTMDYSLSMYFRQAWRDPRLCFKPVNGKITEIRLHDESWNHFWVPDTFFRNEKSASFHKVTVNNRRLTVNSTGHLWYATRITATLSCPMRLKKFPFDIQKCPMQFESFGFTMDTVFFGWVGKPVDYPDDLKLPQFQLVKSILIDCSANYTSGSYPCSEISFVLRRDIGYYVIQVFIPSILTVILSWVSFWINIDGVPARCSLGLLTVLTITTQSSSVNATLPKVSYIKQIDIWMIVCLVFVFCALLEYAFVNVAARNGVRIRTPIVRHAPLQPPPHQQYTDVDACTEQDSLTEEPTLAAKCWQNVRDRVSSNRNFTSTVDVEGSKRRARSIDKFSRKTFPLSFIIFTIVYWISAFIPESTERQLIE